MSYDGIDYEGIYYDGVKDGYEGWSTGWKLGFDMGQIPKAKGVPESAFVNFFC